MFTMCDSSAQSGNGLSTLTAVSESLTIAGSVDGATNSHSQQDNVAEVARQVGTSLLVTIQLHLRAVLSFLTSYTP